MASGSFFILVEIVENFFSRAKVRSLLNGRLVCKLWKISLLNKKFLESYQSKSEIEGATTLRNVVGKDGEFEGLLRWSLYDYIQEEMKILDFGKTEQLKGLITSHVTSVNGILYLSGLNKILLNPLTNQMLTVPPLVHSDRARCSYRSLHGFAVSTVTGVYKLVEIHMSGDPFRASFVFVYTLGTSIGEWRELHLISHIVSYGNCITIGSNIYWDRYSGELILKFNVDSEKFELIEYPRDCSGCNKLLGVFDGKLCITFMGWNSYITCVLESDGWSVHKSCAYTQRNFTLLSVIQSLKDDDYLMVEGKKFLAVVSEVHGSKRIHENEDGTLSLFSVIYEPSLNNMSDEFAFEESHGYIQKLIRNS